MLIYMIGTSVVFFKVCSVTYSVKCDERELFVKMLSRYYSSICKRRLQVNYHFWIGLSKILFTLR